MQKQNPVIKNYILSSEKYVLEEKSGLPRANRPRNDASLRSMTPSHCEEQLLFGVTKQSNVFYMNLPNELLLNYCKPSSFELP